MTDLVPGTQVDLGPPDGAIQIGIVAANFNRFITEVLLKSAMDALRHQGIEADAITLVWVPGAYELPLAADHLLEDEQLDGVLALGAVIRGGTPHFDYVSDACTSGLMEVSLRRGKPVTFGVLTTDTVEQALERASPEEGNKGFDVAMALLQMINLRNRTVGRG